MTVKDFKTAVISTMKDKIEVQRHMSLAVGLAIASAFDAKATKKADQSLDKMLQTLDREQESMFFDIASGSVNRKVRREEDGGLGEEEVVTWQTLTKIDAAFSKLTGKMTGAPWSKVNMGNRDSAMQAFENAAGSTTGQQIMDTISRGAAREGRMRPGRRR